jgi:hypothetical protein
MSSLNPSSKEVCNFFFSLKENYDYLCECGKVCKRSGTSWQNLMTHIRESHPNYIEQMKLALDSSKAPLFSLVDSKSSNLWGWLKFIVGKGVPFNWCEDEVVRDFSKLKPISVETLQKYMELLTKEIETEIEKILPDRFGLIVDEWSEGSEHFFAIFARYEMSQFASGICSSST